MKLLNRYKFHLFDCDGVILNSNKLKADVFYQVAYKFDRAHAHELRQFSESRNGFSRSEIFKFFAQNILKQDNCDLMVEEMIAEFGLLARKRLLECDVVKRLSEIKRKNINSKWMVVSGGDQNELRTVFAQRQILENFELGVFGSPRDKNTIIQEEFKNIYSNGETIFIGDSKTDYEVARKWGFDFLFVGGWSELIGWKEFCAINNIPWVVSLDEMDN